MELKFKKCSQIRSDSLKVSMLQIHGLVETNIARSKSGLKKLLL
jgi:hypothetical protein